MRHRVPPDLGEKDAEVPMLARTLLSEPLDQRIADFKRLDIDLYRVCYPIHLIFPTVLIHIPAQGSFIHCIHP